MIRILFWSHSKAVKYNNARTLKYTEIHNFIMDNIMITNLHD